MSREIADKIEGQLNVWTNYSAYTQGEITAVNNHRAELTELCVDVNSVVAQLTERRSTALAALGESGPAMGNTVFGQWSAFKSHKGQTEAMQSHSDDWDGLLTEVADLDAQVQESKAKAGGWASASAEAFYGQLPVQAQAVMDAKTIMTGLKTGMATASTLHESVYSSLDGIVQEYVSHYSAMGCVMFNPTDRSTWGPSISWGAVNFGTLRDAMSDLYQGETSWRPGNDSIAQGFEENTQSFYTEGSWPVSANPNVDPTQQASNQASNAANMANPDAPGPQDTTGMEN